MDGTHDYHQNYSRTWLKEQHHRQLASTTTVWNIVPGPARGLMGEWTPVFKKGDRHDARNYRPITSLIAVDKIFELLLSNQVTSHYDETLYYRMTAYKKDIVAKQPCLC